MQSQNFLRPLQHAALPHINTVEPVTDDEMTVLAEVREVLARHGKLDRFGVSLLHRHFNLSAGEILVEYTDVERRVQTVRVEPANRPLRDGEGIIETNWVFNDPEHPIKCEAPCQYYRGNHY